MRRTRLAVTAAGLAILTAAGCSGASDGGDGSASDDTGTSPVTIESCGREVVFDAPPERILAIGSEAPELLAAAGAADKVTHYAGSLDVPFSPEVKSIVEEAEHVIEDSHDLSFEAIISTGVDVAIGTDITSTVDIDAMAEKLDKAGVQLVTVSNYCAGLADAPTGEENPGFDLIYRDIASYGKLFGTEQIADESITQLKDRVAAVKEELAGVEPRSAVPLYVNAEGPLGSYGSQALVSEQMKVLGLNNIFTDIAKRYFEPSSEAIVGANPEIVFGLYLPVGDAALKNGEEVISELRSRPELAGVGAVGSDAGIIPLNFYYTTASPLAVDGLELLAETLAG